MQTQTKPDQAQAHIRRQLRELSDKEKDIKDGTRELIAALHKARYDLIGKLDEINNRPLPSDPVEASIEAAKRPAIIAELNRQLKGVPTRIDEARRRERVTLSTLAKQRARLVSQLET